MRWRCGARARARQTLQGLPLSLQQLQPGAPQVAQGQGQQGLEQGPARGRRGGARPHLGQQLAALGGGRSGQGGQAVVAWARTGSSSRWRGPQRPQQPLLPQQQQRLLQGRGQRSQKAAQPARVCLCCGWRSPARTAT